MAAGTLYNGAPHANYAGIVNRKGRASADMIQDWINMLTTAAGIGWS